MSPLRITVWGENVHEHKSSKVKKVYPNGMHAAIAAGLVQHLPNASVTTATLQEPEHGLTVERLRETDVLFWWGHMAHDQVGDEVVKRVHARVLEGMGLIVLHSGHYSKIFRMLMGTSCSLTWREADERERLWVCNPGDPIARGIDRFSSFRWRRCTASHSVSRARGAGVRLVVRGRRRLPERLLLAPRQREHLLFPSRS